ncbi:Mbeg1-like protein [Bacillus toyonensis]|uniref:Mbeg1-like protein n=1 Tax=Bacillus toyonensis TaxID=155322 RepID=UPI0030182AA2
MCSVTDLEYRLLSQLAYFDELTDELTEFQQGKFFTCYELKDFNKTISRLNSELIQHNSELINSIDLDKVLKRWKVLYSLQGFMATERGREVLNDVKEKNKLLDSFVFVKQCFSFDGSDKQHMVIAFRGTRPRWSRQLYPDLIENANTTNFKYFEKEKYQSDWAVSFYQLLSEKFGHNYEISLTGHSKGGALVQKVVLFALQAMQKQVKGVTFSASGILQIVEKEETGMINEEELKTYLNICKNFTINGDNVINIIKALDRNNDTLYVGNHIELEHTSAGNPHRIASSFDKHFGEDEMLPKL